MISMIYFKNGLSFTLLLYTYLFKRRLLSVTTSRIANKQRTRTILRFKKPSTTYHHPAYAVYKIARTYATDTSHLFKYTVLLLNQGPHFQKTQGTSIIAIVRNPKTLTAQIEPRVSTICAVKRRKAQEIMHRMDVVAAGTEAP